MNKHVNAKKVLKARDEARSWVVDLSSSWAARNPFGLDLSKGPIIRISPCYPDYKEYEMAVATITPEQAKLIIERYNRNNRPIRRNHVDSMARDMTNHRWGVCVNGVVFDEDWFLTEAQHRFLAMIKSGQPQQFTVYFKVSRKIVELAGVVAKSYADIMVMNGLDPARAKDMNNCLRRFQSSSHRSTTFVELSEVVRKHKDPLSFTMDSFFPPAATKRGRKSGAYVRQPRLTSGPVLAGVARAWHYFDDHKKLKRFVDILLRRELPANSDEYAAAALRDWLLITKQSGSIAGRICARATQECIRCFMFDIPVTVFTNSMVPPNDVYPLPESNPALGIQNGLTNKTVAYYNKIYK